MNDLAYIFYSIKSRSLNSSLSVLLTSFGIMIALLLSQFSNHIKNRLDLDGKGIDIVVGAKGSPLQLVLSSIYHIDIPNGNIPYKSALEISKNPLIEKAIPLALGDNWKGYRIVGTSYDYLKHFDVKIDQGRLWNDEFEMVAGADIDVKINQKISGSHGLIDGGGVHDEHTYKIVGSLKRSGTVVDRLLLTSVNSVLEIHGLEDIDHDTDHNHDHKSDQSSDNHHESHRDGKHNHKEKTKDHHEEHVDDHHKDHKDEHHNHKHSEKHENISDKEIININSLQKNKESFKENLNESEITALLIKTNSPIANINLPRSINRETNMQAANPALEITRLTAMLGFGSKTFSILSTLLISIAILSIFSGLAGNLENRMGDLAILRALGYTKQRIFKIIVLEGTLIISFGILLGVIMSFFVFEIFSNLITPLNVSKAKFVLNFDFYFIIIIVLFSGFIASLIPAYNGSKISVANQLSQNI